MQNYKYFWYMQMFWKEILIMILAITYLDELFKQSLQQKIKYLQ